MAGHSRRESGLAARDAGESASVASMRRVTLPSGLRAVILENHLAPVVALQAWVDVGAADEVGRDAGIAHVFEHMLFKGTARRGVGEIAKAVEAAGGDINAWTSHDQTVYHLVMASRYFDTGLDVLADALQCSSFDPDELQRELKVVLEEIKQGEDSPQRVVTQSLFREAYAGHPYARPVIGTARTVSRFTRDQLLVFFRRYYVPSNVTLVVVGDVDADRALEAIDRAFGADGRPRRPSRPIFEGARSYSAMPQRGPRATTAVQDVHEGHVALSFHIPGLLHEDTGALDVAAILLGQGESSRLNLRVKRNQLATDCVAYSHSPRGPGLLVLSAATAPDGLVDATRALSAEVLRLTREEVTGDEIAKAQAIIDSDAVYQKETVQGMARKLGFFETAAGGLEYEEEYQRQVARVTPESLRRVMSRYLDVGAMTIAALAPRKPRNGAHLDERLLRAAREASHQVDRETRPAVPARPKRHRQGAVVREAIVRHVLPSGMRILVRREASVPLIALRSVWLGGLRYEDVRSNGINNLLASLVTRGTSKRGAEDIAREIEGMAGALAGFTGRNSFGVRAELLSRHFDRGLETFAECIVDPALSHAELEKERQQVLDEIHAQQDNLTSVAFRLFWGGLYRRSPYRLDLIGTPTSVKGLNAARLAAYYRRHYPPSAMALAIVGDVDPERVIARCAALLGRSLAERGKAPAVLTEKPRADGPRTFTEERDKQQTHLVIGYPGTTLDDPDRFPLEVLSTILSGQGGRLFVELRDRKGLAYRLSAYSLEGVDPGYVAVYLACSPQNIEVARRGVLEELERISTALVSRDELDRAQRYLVGSHEISLQRRTALAASLAFNESYGVGYDEHLRYAPAVLAVTAADVRRVARRFFDRQKEITSIVGPLSALRA
jgi:zinc protease